MVFTHFTLTQNGKEIGTEKTMQQAIDVAKRYAAKNGMPVSVVGHTDDGKTREVIYHPDGWIQKIWLIAMSTHLRPEVGRTYRNAGGSTFRCEWADGNAQYYLTVLPPILKQLEASYENLSTVEATVMSEILGKERWHS